MQDLFCIMHDKDNFLHYSVIPATAHASSFLCSLYQLLNQLFPFLAHSAFMSVVSGSKFEWNYCTNEQWLS